MKYLLSALVMSVSLNAMAVNCRTLTSNLKRDINALGEYLETSADVRKTKSSVAKDMVRQHVEDSDEANYQWNLNSIPEDWAVAGTVTRKGAYYAILNTFEGWYSENAEGENQIKEVQKLTYQALSYDGVTYGFDTGVQGWGGSPAVNLMFLVPECKTNIIVFLGISHD